MGHNVRFRGESLGGKPNDFMQKRLRFLLDGRGRSRLFENQAARRVMGATPSSVKMPFA